MFQLRALNTNLQSQIIHSLEMDYEEVIFSNERFVFENGSYIRSLAKQIVDGGNDLFNKTFMKETPIQKYFDLNQPNILENLSPEITKEMKELKNVKTNFDFILNNQGEESVINDIRWLLLKFPNHLPDEIVGWEIPEFDEEIPEDGKIFFVKKV